MTQKQIIEHLLKTLGTWIPEYSLTKREVVIDGVKHWLGSSADRTARKMCEGESPILEREMRGKYAYMRIKPVIEDHDCTAGPEDGCDCQKGRE